MFEGNRKLIDLVSVGPATLKDFELLGITHVQQLKSQNAETLYKNLCELSGVTHDICVLDVFRAAIEQAKNPKLPKEQCQWWYWSRVRKS